MLTDSERLVEDTVMPQVKMYFYTQRKSNLLTENSSCNQLAIPH